MASVVLSDVKKTYDHAVPVIHGIDMRIADGEFVVIVGPSGCGKSTLLRMIAGLEAITSGTVEIAGRVVNALEPKDRDIAMVFQNYALYPHMSVYQNMAYGLKIAGMPKARIDERVQRAAAILELEPLLQRKPRQLSGGQRQRVAMGRAIVREPAVFLFDEPLSNLDAKLRVQMRLEIKKLQRQLGTTSVYVTHDQVEAMTLADRLVVMNAGRAEQIGSPMEVYETPATAYVGGFIGSPAMNILDGTLAADRRSVRLSTTDGSQGVEVALPGTAQMAGGEKVLLGLRPEDFVARTAATQLPLRIELSEPLGADTLLHGVLHGQRQTVTVRLPGHVRTAPGEPMAFDLVAERVHLFAVDGGRRVAMQTPAEAHA